MPRFGAPETASIAGPRSTEVRSSLSDTNPEARMRAMVDRYLEFVAGVLRSAGTPEADVEDEVQRTFMTAARRLDDIQEGKEKAFLFGIAVNLAAHARRTMTRRREVLENRMPDGVESRTPEDLLDRKRMRELLDRVVGQMHSRHREVFVLHEFEEMPVSEVAAVLAISPGTAASRLRRARAEFRLRVAGIEPAYADIKSLAIPSASA
jgi:RNA polymerase sigma-70 factor (ECF subfamily)